jgi:predicted HD phosphohydrolase
MTPAEVETFRAQPDWQLALELREIDDRGKVSGARVPGLDDYRADLEALVAGKGPHSFRQSTS